MYQKAKNVENGLHYFTHIFASLSPIAFTNAKEGPYQDRPPLCPFRLSPLLTCSGSTIAFLKILKIQGPNPKI